MAMAAAARWAMIGLFTLSAMACGRQVEDLLASGDQFMAEQKFRDAIVQYRNALQQDPKSGLAHYRLGQAMVLAGEESAALKTFVRAADLLPDDNAVQLDAARALLRAGLFEDAGTRAMGVLKREPNNVDAHILRAHATAGLNDFGGAIDAVEAAINLDPTRSELYVRLGALQALSGQVDVAEAAYKQAIAVSPQLAAPHLALANYYWRRGSTDQAERAIKTAVEVDATNVKANRALARLYLVTGRRVEAEAQLRAVAQNSTDLQDKLVLGDYLVSQKRLPEALEVFDALGREPAAAAAANARIAGIRYEQGQPEQAHALVDQLIANEPRNAELLVVKGRWLFAENKLDEALTFGQKATSLNPRLAAAHALVGSFHAARGHNDEAIKAYTEVLLIDPRSASASIQLARLHLAAGRAGQAQNAAQDAVRIEPFSGDARFVLARALLAQGEVEKAAAELRPVADAAPDDAAVQTLAGQIQRRQGQAALARQSFERALKVNATSVEALTSLVAMDVAAKQVDRAVARVNAALEQAPDQAPLLLLAARTYATAGDEARAEATLRHAIDVDPAFLPAYGVLGQLYVNQSKLDEARGEYEKLIAKRPNDVGAATMAAMILHVQNKPEEARKRYEQILSVNPRAVVAANNLAYMYAESGGNLDVALQLAQAAKASAPDDPDVNDTLGWVYYKRNLPQLALDPLQQSAAKDPTNPTYHYHLGLAYLKTGDNSRARQALERALALDASFSDAAEAKRVLASMN